MKGILFLCLALLFSTGAQAYHPGTVEQDVPLPVKKCFTGIELYRQIFIGRAAGLTLDEALLDNSFAIRVLKYIAETNGKDYEDMMMGFDIDAKTVEVYELSEPHWRDHEWQADWATVKFDECIAAIPKESVEPPKPDDNSNDRMLDI